MSFETIDAAESKELKKVTSPITSHFSELRDLSKLGFDPEIIVRLNPNLLTGPSGAATNSLLNLWQTLGVRLPEGESDVTALLAYKVKNEHIDSSPNGFRASVFAARLSIFEGLTPDSIELVRESDNTASATINHPSFVYKSSRFGSEAQRRTELFSTNREIPLEVSEHYIIARGFDVTDATNNLRPDFFHGSLEFSSLITRAQRDDV